MTTVANDAPSSGRRQLSIVRRTDRLGDAQARPPAPARRPDPKPLAEYALLRDGVTAVNLRSPDVDDRFEHYRGPRFWDHQKTCPVPSMTTARAALEHGLGYEVDPHREEQRRRLIAAGRSPWVKRSPGV